MTTVKYMSDNDVPPRRKREGMRTTAEVLVTVFDVKVDLVGDARALGSLDGLGTEEGRDGDEQEAQGEPTEDHGGRRGKGRVWCGRS